MGIFDYASAAGDSIMDVTKMMNQMNQHNEEMALRKQQEKRIAQAQQIETQKNQFALQKLQEEDKRNKTVVPISSITGSLGLVGKDEEDYAHNVINSFGLMDNSSGVPGIQMGNIPLLKNHIKEAPQVALGIMDMRATKIQSAIEEAKAVQQKIAESDMNYTQSDKFKEATANRVALEKKFIGLNTVISGLKQRLNPKEDMIVPQGSTVLRGGVPVYTNPAAAKPVNMPAWYDAMGATMMGSGYHTTDGQKQFADWVKDPKNANAIDAFQKKYTANNTPSQMMFLQTPQGYAPATTKGAGAGTIGPSSGVMPMPTNTWIGNDANGNPLIMPSKGDPTLKPTQAPQGGVMQKNPSEDYKKDVTAIGQAKDLIGGLQRNWNNLKLTGKVEGTEKYLKAYAGEDPDARYYIDGKDALLGNLSRSIAAERGVLTQQDIDRIRMLIPKIGKNPLTNDSPADATKKWSEINSILRNAEKRLSERFRITGANPTGTQGTGTQRKPLSAFDK